MELTIRDALAGMRDWFRTPGHEIALRYTEDGDSDGCMYRTPDGQKCAVGCLIPDENYRPYFEGLAIPQLLTRLEWFSKDVLVEMVDNFNDNYADDVEMNYLDPEGLRGDFESEARNAAFVFHLLNDDERKGEFLRKAQLAHDESKTPAEFVNKLNALAAEFKLEV